MVEPVFFCRAAHTKVHVPTTPVTSPTYSLLDEDVVGSEQEDEVEEEEEQEEVGTAVPQPAPEVAPMYVPCRGGVGWGGGV